MKGTRAKKAAEAAAINDVEAGALTPTAPKEPRPGPPRPGPIIQVPAGFVQIPEDTFKSLCRAIRTNELLGAAAADQLEEAAGLRGAATPQGKAAKELRSNIADNREADNRQADNREADNLEAEESAAKDQKPKKEVGGFVEEEVKPTKKRVSISEESLDITYDLEVKQTRPEKDGEEPPELNLNPKQNHMRTDLEMWVMDEIPALFGISDSDDLAEELQEDGQALKITCLIAELDAEAQRKLLEDWLESAPDADLKEAFITTLLDRTSKIQALGPKKKKKKKGA